MHPFDGWTVTIQKRDKAARDIWEQDRVNAVLTGHRDRDRPIPLLSATCGHRQSESFAVALEDLNRFRKEVTIRHQVKRVNGKLVLTPPKGGKVRTVPLPNVTATALAEHVKEHGTTPVRCTCCGKDWQVIFTQHGGLISARDWSRDAWHPALIKAGLAPGRMNGQHNLRHAFVAVLIDGGASAQQVRDYCGHASIKITLDVYGHLFERSHDRARAIMDDAFSAGVYPLRTAKGQ